MSTTREATASEERIVERFRRYLNGPVGKTVLDNLDEGESFILQTSEHTLRITKSRGKAIVSLVDSRFSKKPSRWTLPTA
ncbi:MAG: hypothetical protein JSW61_14445 [Candidatus Thorarchaeota archaeon]|nr:MAG: hypothetical protein JSW61_14445 [Candidatus Thorarchaeota archaeon]